MSARRRNASLGIVGQTADEVARFIGRAALGAAFAVKFDQRLQAWPFGQATDTAQVVGIGDGPAVPNLQPPVAFVRLLAMIMHHSLEAQAGGIGKQVLHFLMQSGLVALHGQHIVAAARHNRLGDVSLTADRINRDDAATSVPARATVPEWP